MDEENVMANVAVALDTYVIMILNKSVMELYE
jgi:hypothetical protein